MRAGRSPDWDRVIESLELLMDPTVFHEALQTASLAFEHDRSGLDWRAILTPQLEKLSTRSARLATVLAQVGFFADAAVGLSPSHIIKALASATATAEAGVLQAESKAKQTRAPCRQRTDEDTRATQPSLRQLAALFGRHPDGSRKTSIQSSATKTQASPSFADQDVQNDAIDGGSGAPALKRTRPDHDAQNLSLIHI